MLSGRGLYDELITRPEESYRLCCVVVCDLETSRMGAPYIYDISRLRFNANLKLCLRLSTCASVGEKTLINPTLLTRSNDSASLVFNKLETILLK